MVFAQPSDRDLSPVPKKSARRWLDPKNNAVVLPSPVDVTVLNIPLWEKYLEGINQLDVNWVLRGIQEGFLLGTQPGPLVSAKRNCSSSFKV